MIAQGRLHSTLGYSNCSSVQFAIHSHGDFNLWAFAVVDRICYERKELKISHCIVLVVSMQQFCCLKTSPSLQVEANQTEEVFWMVHTIQLAPFLLKSHDKKKGSKDIWDFCMWVTGSPETRKIYPASIISLLKCNACKCAVNIYMYLCNFVSNNIF